MPQGRRTGADLKFNRRTDEAGLFIGSLAEQLSTSIFLSCDVSIPGPLQIAIAQSRVRFSGDAEGDNHG